MAVALLQVCILPSSSHIRRLHSFLQTLPACLTESETTFSSWISTELQPSRQGIQLCSISVGSNHQKSLHPISPVLTCWDLQHKDWTAYKNILLIIACSCNVHAIRQFPYVFLIIVLYHFFCVSYEITGIALSELKWFIIYLITNLSYQVYFNCRVCPAFAHH